MIQHVLYFHLPLTNKIQRNWLVKLSKWQSPQTMKSSEIGRLVIILSICLIAIHSCLQNFMFQHLSQKGGDKLLLSSNIGRQLSRKSKRTHLTLPESWLQTIASLFWSPDAIIEPSGEKRTVVIGPRCFSSTVSSVSM